MSQKALDVLFRHKILIALPVVLLLLGGIALATTQSTSEYESRARIWTQRTPLLASRLGVSDSFSTPASSQARVINDLMSTQSFRRNVAAKVPQLSGLPEGEQIAAVREGTAVFSSGTHILNVMNKGDDPQLSQAIVTGIIDTYTETFQDNVVAEAAAAESFYEARLEEAQTELEAEQAALLAYREQIGAEEGELIANDPQLASLTARVDRAEADYDEALDRLEGVHLELDAALQGRDLSFQVMDPANTPTNAITTPKRDLLMFPVLGLLLGLAASGSVLFMLYRMDGAVRLPAEASNIGLPLLAVVPNLGNKRKRRWPQDFVRRVVAVSRGLSRSPQQS